jgi:hypothetical protein
MGIKIKIKSYERYLSAQEEKEKKDPRFFGSPKNKIRPPGYQRPTPQRTEKIDRLTYVKKSFSFEQKERL